MVKNYFKIAIRSLLKHKLYSAINVLSLTVGMTCSILLYLYVSDELSYDKFNSNKDSIYRVVKETRLPDGSLQWQGIFHAIPLGPVLKEEIPEIESYARFYKPHGEVGYYIKRGDKVIFNDVLYADYELFDLFDFPVKQGSIDKNSLNTVVLSERAARKYFGRDNPINQVLSFRIDDEYIDFSVSAVIHNIPSNSSVQFDVLLPFSYITEVGGLKRWATHWGFGAIITYVKLREGTNPLALEEKLKGIMASRYPNYENVAAERGYERVEDYRSFRLEPLTDVHFNTSIFEGLAPSSSPMYSYVLIGLVIGILGIACFNFMNLSLSRSAHRVKEVGLRKTIGAMRGQLIKQFLGESVLLSFLAFGISLLFADLLLPVFNYLTGKQIALSALFSVQSLSILVLITLIAGLIAGFYPAFVISRFNIKETLAGIKHKGTGSLTKTLIVLQFAVATTLIMGMLVMNRQIDYLLTKELGFDSQQVITLKNAVIGEGSIYAHLKNTATEHDGVYSITSADQSFGDPSGLSGRSFEYKGEEKRVGIIRVTDHYLKTMGIRLSEGQGFIADSRENIVIINQACAMDFELEPLSRFEDLTGSPETDPYVVGVMDDFNYSSLKTEVFPMLIQKTSNIDLGNIFIKLSGTQSADAIAHISKEWQKVAPDLPFEYSFLSDTMEAQYESEERWGKIIYYSMIITVLLSALGLVGIVALGLESKRKEISIRKVFGARVRTIVWLISNTYLKLVLVSYLLAVPLSYKLIDTWLSGFAYKIAVDFTIYVVAGISILLVALFTIAAKTVGAAAQNPVKFLRNE